MALPTIITASTAKKAEAQRIASSTSLSTGVVGGYTPLGPSRVRSPSLDEISSAVQRGFMPGSYGRPLSYGYGPASIPPSMKIDKPGFLRDPASGNTYNVTSREGQALLADYYARKAKAAQAAKQAAVEASPASLAVDKLSLDRQKTVLDREAKTLASLQAEIAKRQKSMVSRSDVYTNKLVSEYNKRSKSLAVKANRYNTRADIYNLQAQAVGMRPIAAGPPDYGAVKKQFAKAFPSTKPLGQLEQAVAAGYAPLHEFGVQFQETLGRGGQAYAAGVLEQAKRGTVGGAMPIDPVALTAGLVRQTEYEASKDKRFSPEQRARYRPSEAERIGMQIGGTTAQVAPLLLPGGAGIAFQVPAALSEPDPGVAAANLLLGAGTGALIRGASPLIRLGKTATKAGSLAKKAVGVGEKVVSKSVMPGVAAGFAIAEGGFLASELGDEAAYERASKKTVSSLGGFLAGGQVGSRAAGKFLEPLEGAGGLIARREYVKTGTARSKAFAKSFDLAKEFKQVDLPKGKVDLSKAERVTKQTARITERFLRKNKSVVLGGSASQVAQFPKGVKQPVPADVDLYARNASKTAQSLYRELKAGGRNVRVKKLEEGIYSIYETVAGKSQKAIEVHDIGQLYQNIGEVRGLLEPSGKSIIQDVSGIKMLSLETQAKRKVVGWAFGGRTRAKDIKHFQDYLLPVLEKAPRKAGKTIGLSILPALNQAGFMSLGTGSLGAGAFGGKAVSTPALKSFSSVFGAYKPTRSYVTSYGYGKPAVGAGYGYGFSSRAFERAYGIAKAGYAAPKAKPSGYAPKARGFDPLGLASYYRRPVKRATGYYARRRPVGFGAYGYAGKQPGYGLPTLPTTRETGYAYTPKETPSTYTFLKAEKEDYFKPPRKQTGYVPPFFRQSFYSGPVPRITTGGYARTYKDSFWRPPPPPPTSLLKLPKFKAPKGGASLGFGLQVRRKGRFVDVKAPTLTYGSAKRLGAYLTDVKGLAASFRVLPRPGRGMELAGLPKFRAERFRKPVKGSKLPAGTFIERAKFRLSSGDEILGIQKARKAKRGFRMAF